MNRKTNGFTLIELLIVIGILAVLATVTVLVLNPAQLFSQARDSQRITDLGSLKGAISLYLTSSNSPDLDGASETFTCGSLPASNFGASISSVTASPFSAGTLAHGKIFTVDGNGWVPVNFASSTGGSPLPTLNRDPINDTSNGLEYFYAYACNNTAKTFELVARMESERYKSGGDDNVVTTDGGNNADFYETGTEPGLDL
ncbi:MAG: hypothetical protein COU11_04220 [Candidatus Harrisonbacteria bacterium CG10_big_fil_rev_8_21_14_0_10_49_15]|uniref:Type II secretion system protein GspG C-terminal domain-containing protein n=1 Tax=Candidatus Harrisonbacteria bacterium CG10_big_fil_rev_8_21_14_0_10_49_15 TaxID=1974587 RepID=A0A2H0UJW2_9BACT|nr:MAG: hypothetical protein COU11_04220 [Candidatus Harrisonbacteria bacterium CG10_big_fil_rev_8_21_14_0_10_49_15]